MLGLASSGLTGVLRLSRELRIGPARLIRLLDEMREEGLVDIDEIHSKRAGRPMRRVAVTELGKDYMDTYNKLALRLLRSRRADLQRASADADYARRLASKGVPPYDLFLELIEVTYHAGRSPV